LKIFVRHVCKASPPLTVFGPGVKRQI
jgi:hypothetical protein